MRLILDGVVNNPNLPLIDPAMQLINADTLAIYGMTNNQDASGRSGALITNAVFDAQGVNLTNDAAGVIQTPVMETPELTIITVWNIAPVSGQISNAVGNMTPAVAPYSGFRVIAPSSGTSQLQSATGVSSPATNVVTTNFTGAWTTAGFTITDTSLIKWHRSGGNALPTAAVTQRSRNTNTPIYINGFPANVNAPARGGFTGKIALMAFYSKAYDSATMVDLMNKARDIATARGLTIP